MKFEWDPRKDAANRRKHGVGLREAATVFGDPFATTFQDIDHSVSEQRFLTIGVSAKDVCWLSRIRKKMRQQSASSAHDRLRVGREDSMKKPSKDRNHGDMRDEYDFASMEGGVRGKHFEEYRKGTNVVLLKPDVAEAFPTEDAVNEALRGILLTTRAVRRIGGLPDRALQSTPSTSKRSRRRG